MQALVQQISGDFNTLLTQGATLCDPNVLDGASAADFRGNLWPGMQTDIRNMQEGLPALAQALNRLINDIMTAGGG
jgi:hypothetical protein